jgi:hypothetical protein|tara:strand:- start:268 stop:888 length:621 start_codon:yes stop_codon:yes gene_type:complete
MRAVEQNDLNFNIKKGSVNDVDAFDFPVPGHSLTDIPNSKSWDKPPEFTDADEAVSFIAEKINKPEVKENFLRLMAAGVSVEQIVNTISLGGFSDGRWNPDLAEIIKPPVAMLLVDMAIKNKIPVKIFEGNPHEQDESQRISPQNTLKVMKERQPEEFDKIMKMSQYMKAKEQEPESEGFINMEQQTEQLPIEEEESIIEEGGEVV